MRRKRLLCSRGYQPRSSWPTPPMTPITCAKPSPPKARSPSFPTTRRARSNIRSTSISMPSAISLNAASQSSSNSAALQPASKRQPEITLQSSPSQPSSYGCDKCPHHLAFRACRFVERGTQALGELDRVVIRPEMHEEEPRLFVQHVTVERRDVDAMRPQCGDHRVHLVAGQHEIA